MRNLSTAWRLIPPPANKKVLWHNTGTTSDIVDVILKTAPLGVEDTRQLARALKGDTVYDTCRRIWHFLKSNIAYKKDPSGRQYIQTPAYTWRRGRGDCKSYSIFVSSLLKNLGINHSFRFTGYVRGSKDFTHVYIVVPDNSRLIIMDVVMPVFNKEKLYTFKKDYSMSRIYQMSGIGDQPRSKDKINFDLGNRSIDQITEGEMDLLIARDRLLTEKKIVEGMRGIGSLKAERYQDTLDLVNDALEAIHGFKIGAISDITEEMDLIIDDVESGNYKMAGSLVGIGDIGSRKERRKQKKAERKAARKEKKAERKATKPKTKTGRVLKKIAQAVKKGGKAVAKVLTAPARLVAKGILEVTLPKAAPHFLYLFLTDAEAASAPKKVQEKREKQKNQARFITDGIGMKEKHFMGIVRNGIMKKYNKSPEAVIKDMKAKKILGIFGIGQVVVGAAAVSAVIEIIQKIAGFLKKKEIKVDDQSAADSKDWEGYSSSTAQNKGNVKTDVETQAAREDDFSDGMRSLWDSLKF